MSAKRSFEERVKRALKSKKELSTLWGVFQRIHKLTSSDEFSSKDLARIIESDAVLTARILRLVNSEQFGFSQEISTLEQAVVVLGYKPIRDLCTSLVALRTVGESTRGGFDRRAMWKHSLGTALSSKIIQSRLFGTEDPELFAAGLLCNIGRVVLDQHFPEEFSQITKLVKKGATFEEAELEIVQTTHAEIGYWAARSWKLSPRLARAIRAHHEPKSNQWAQVLNVGYAITHALNMGSPGGKSLTILAPGVLASLQVDAVRLTELVRSTSCEFQRSASVFSVAA